MKGALCAITNTSSGKYYRYESIDSQLWVHCSADKITGESFSDCRMIEMGENMPSDAEIDLFK